ncbi:peptide ABC transporter substrate-binding protein [Levilactobacillus namurensis]|uniref:peptide ABC transporter substrate-binding protein n=1 Tax=Levilactobacillus namurensis TaxID=380393 RepID=UPI00222FA6DA|nr:peptide ABC transporter substrate-binding protein [Levilactobacillus namurensis]MCW3779207.1 peptide ABC transporter substrate-binding protein [Levilactobacillus namurensis]MDT7019950.1 peptide ABC transporter substrate-binding protein [Levilactobacillus namurensis]WNN65472.1 peptide ABC transporter substrate-binding protein [Levilactobacillus namurensis]
MQHKGIYVALSAISLLALAGCGSKAAGNTGNSKYAANQVLNWSESQELATSDLSKVTDTVSFTMLQNTQEGLYRLDKTGKPANAIATSTKVTNGGKDYVFNLRHNAKWSNGDPVTAHDFVYSWQRSLDPKTACQDAYYMYAVRNAKAINQGKLAPSTLGIKADGNYRLEVHLTKPVSYFSKLLAWPLFYPLNQKAVQQYGKRFGTTSATTVSDGPYKLTKWNGTSKTWTLAKNPKYWNHANVHLTAINYQVNQSTTTSFNLFTAKKLDETSLNGQQVKNSLNNPNFVKRLPTGTQRLDFNQNKVKAFKSLAVRQAISTAIDRKQLVNDVLQDGSVASNGFVPHGIGKNPKTGEAFDQEAEVPSAATYDLKRAKQLLAKGYKETGTKSIDATLSVSDTDGAKKVAEFVQSSLQKLPGVKISIKSVPYVQLMTQQANGNYQLTFSGWQSVFADPIEFLNVFAKGSSFNTTGWKNAQFYDLLNQAENQDGNQPTKRWAKLVAAEKVLMKTQATVPLYQQAQSQLLRTNVKGIIYNPAGVPYDFTDAYIGNN